MTHPNCMLPEELRELVWDMANAALDLAQHLSFTHEMLREDLRDGAYEKAIKMAYDIVKMPDGDYKKRDPRCDVVFFGAEGLTRPDITLDDLIKSVGDMEQKEDL